MPSHRLAKDIRRTLGLSRRNVEVGATPEALCTGGVHQDAALFQRSRHRLGRAEVGIDIHPDDIGLDVRRVKAKTGRVGNSLPDETSVAVIFGEPINMVVERI